MCASPALAGRISFVHRVDPRRGHVIDVYIDDSSADRFDKELRAGEHSEDGAPNAGEFCPVCGSRLAPVDEGMSLADSSFEC